MIVVTRNFRPASFFRVSTVAWSGLGMRGSASIGTSVPSKSRNNEMRSTALKRASMWSTISAMGV
jgi:hypothetical protein